MTAYTIEATNYFMTNPHLISVTSNLEDAEKIALEATVHGCNPQPRRVDNGETIVYITSLGAFSRIRKWEV